MIDTDSPYTPTEEAEVAADLLARGPQAAADMFRRFAERPENAPIADKIREIAKRFDELSDAP